MIKGFRKVFNVNFTDSCNWLLIFVQILIVLKHYRHAILLFLFALFCFPTVGQHYVHSTIWLRLAPSWEINEHWSLTSDFWYRRQNDLHNGLHNPVAAPLLSPSGRVGLAYRTEHWAFTLYPVCVFRSHPALGKEADYTRPRTQEFRPHLLVEWSQDLPRQFSVRVRGGYEYRLFPGVPATGRGRFRVLLRRELSDQTYLSLWNETLIPVPPNIAVRQLYETNRTNFAIGRSLTEHLTLEAGYQFSYRQRRTLVEFDEEHAITVTAFCRF